MKVSICITSYEAHGKGSEFIRNNIKHCLEQTYRPLEIIISDHSINTDIEKEVKLFSNSEIDIKYIRYEENRGFPCSNWNNAVNYATGEWIRILALDDYLAYPDAITDSMKFILENPQYSWYVSHRIDENNGLRHKRNAVWNSNILQINTLSGPSCVMLKKELYQSIQLDPELIWFLDLDWYYRLYKNKGKPGIIPFYTWVNSQHPFQLTHTAQTLHLFELSILKTKYGSSLPLSP